MVVIELTTEEATNVCYALLEQGRILAGKALIAKDDGLMASANHYTDEAEQRNLLAVQIAAKAKI